MLLLNENKVIEPVDLNFKNPAENFWISQNFPNLVLLGLGSVGDFVHIDKIVDVDTGKTIIKPLALNTKHTEFSSEGYLVATKIDTSKFSSSHPFIKEDAETIIIKKDGSIISACFDLVKSRKAKKCNLYDGENSPYHFGIEGKIFFFMDHESNRNFVDLEKNEIICKFSENQIGLILPRLSSDGKIWFVKNPGIGPLRSNVLAMFSDRKVFSIDQNGTVEASGVELKGGGTVYPNRCFKNNLVMLADKSGLGFKSGLKADEIIIVNLKSGKEIGPFRFQDLALLNQNNVLVSDIENGEYYILDNDLNKVSLLDIGPNKSIVLSGDASLGYSWFYVTGEHTKEILILKPDMTEFVKLKDCPIKFFNEIKNINTNGELIAIEGDDYSLIMNKEGFIVYDGSKFHQNEKLPIRLIGDNFVFSKGVYMVFNKISDFFSSVDINDNKFLVFNGTDRFLKPGLNGIKSLEGLTVDQLKSDSLPVIDIGNGAVEISGKKFKKKLIKF